MGFFANWRKRREAKRLAKQRQREAAIRRQRISALRANLTQTEDYIRSFSNLGQATGNEPIVLKRGEQIVFHAVNVGLVEVRRVRVSGQNGTNQASVDEPTVVDVGDFVITNKRAVFVGPKNTRSFEWSKLLSCNPQNRGNGVFFMMPVENRQRVSGVSVGSQFAGQLKMNIEFAIAMHQDLRDEFIAGLQDKAADIRTQLEEPAS